MDSASLNVLHLPGWTVTGASRFDRPDGPVEFTASPPDADAFPACPGRVDGGRLRCHGRLSATYANIPAYGRHVRIKVERPRFRCRCGWTGCAEVPDIDDRRKMTARCAAYVIDRAALDPFGHVARDFGIAAATVRAVATKAWEAVASYEFPTPRYFGIDEIILSGRRDVASSGPRPRAIFVDIESRRVLDILPDNRKASVGRWILGLPDRHCVRVVTTNFEPSYREVARALLPDAQLAGDKWHAMKEIWDAPDRVRVETLRAAGQTVFNDAETLRMRNILRARRVEPSDKRWLRLQAFLAQHRNIKLAHATKNMCCEIWDYAERPNMASFHFLRWFEAVASLPACVGRHFEPLCETIARNAPDVLNYFERPLTNAPTEAVNRVLRYINGAGQCLAFAALRHRVRVYSRAKVSRLFLYASCLSRVPVAKKFVLPMRVDFGGDLFIEDKFRLCGPCKSLTATTTERRPVTTCPVPQEPRIASADERCRMGKRPGALVGVPAGSLHRGGVKAGRGPRRDPLARQASTGRRVRVDRGQLRHRHWRLPPVTQSGTAR